MKKIVGIVTAAAIATSVFAADVSAATKIKGNLFGYDEAKKMTLLNENNDSHDYANPNMTFSISDDKAGATVKLTTDGGDKAVKMTTQTIWFKPVDALKITAGNFDIALNKEQIDWTESVTGLGGNGFLASVNVEGFGLDVGFTANGADWLSKKDADDPKTADVDESKTVIKQFFVKAGYSADFGTIGAFAEFNRHKDGRKTYADHDLLFGWNTLDAVYGKGASRNETNMYKLKDGEIGDILFGAGYRNNFNGIDVFCNVNGYMADKFEWIRPEVYVSGSADAFGYSLFVAPVIFADSDLEADPMCEVVAKVTYAMDGITPYAYFKSFDVIGKNYVNDESRFVSTIKLGATGSVGAMGWNLWCQIDTGKTVGTDLFKKTAFSVPFELTMSF